MEDFIQLLLILYVKMNDSRENVKKSVQENDHPEESLSQWKSILASEKQLRKNLQKHLPDFQGKYIPRDPLTLAKTYLNPSTSIVYK